MRWTKQFVRRRGAAIGYAAALLIGVPAGAGITDPLDEFFKLEDQMAQVHEAYLGAIEPEHAEGAAKPGSASVPDKRPAILKQMDALTASTLGTPSGAPIALGTFFWSWNLDLDLGGLFRRFEGLVAHYPDNGGMDDVLPSAVEIAFALKAPQQWAGALEKLSRTAKRAQSKTGALLALGQLWLRAEEPAKAREAFKRMLGSTTDGEMTKLAKGYLFETDHLQIGMVAPSFATRTLDGKPITLESLRGKAVLLNFWASW